MILPAGPGLYYRLRFQSPSTKKAYKDDKIAKRQISMIPTRGIVVQEPRYLLDPAALDSILQLAIMAAPGGRHNLLVTGHIPVSLPEISEHLGSQRGQKKLHLLT